MYELPVKHPFSLLVFPLHIHLSCLSRLFSGATLFVIGSHAAFRELDASDLDELLMEPV